MTTPLPIAATFAHDFRTFECRSCKGTGRQYRGSVECASCRGMGKITTNVARRGLAVVSSDAVATVVSSPVANFRALVQNDGSRVDALVATAEGSVVVAFRGAASITEASDGAPEWMLEWALTRMAEVVALLSPEWLAAHAASLLPPTTPTAQAASVAPVRRRPCRVRRTPAPRFVTTSATVGGAA